MFSEGEMTQGRMESTRRSGPHIEKVLEKLLRALSMWVIPLAIALFSLLALSAWDDRYSSEPLQQLESQALLDESGELTAKEALARLATEKNRQQYETRLSEAPVWFRIPLKETLIKSPRCGEIVLRGAKRSVFGAFYGLEGLVGGPLGARPGHDGPTTGAPMPARAVRPCTG